MAAPAPGFLEHPELLTLLPGLARTLTILDYALGGYRQSECSLLSSILGSLRKGDLLLGDRRFAGAPFYVEYMNHGLEFLTRAHQRLKIARVKRLIRYSREDFIGRLNLGKLHRRKDPSLPTHIDVRFLKTVLRIRGRRQIVWLVTSLLDPGRYPAQQIVDLYAWRWRIETQFRELKVLLHGDVLRSQTPDGIRKEIIARMTALNVVHILMLEAARTAGVQDPLRISFVHAVRAILSFSPALGHAPLAAVPGIYHAMLVEIASHLNPERPCRLEPRAFRRDHKAYPSLLITRAQWKARHHASSAGAERPATCSRAGCRTTCRKTRACCRRLTRPRDFARKVDELVNDVERAEARIERLKEKR